MIDKKKINHKDKDFFDLTGIPLFDSSNFEYYEKNNFFGKYLKEAKNINKLGFCKLEIKERNFIYLIDQIKNDLSQIKEFKEYDYKSSKSLRIQDAWLHKGIKSVKELATYPLILEFLDTIFGRKSFPFQTLNFPFGSRQHFHSDAVHFNSLPKGFMVGVWIALEDVHKDSGPLIYFPKSHKTQYISARNLGITTTKLNEEKYPQKLFESYWVDLVKKNNFTKEILLAKKGDVFILYANLLHGGDVVKNNTLTRWSQVTHYFFEDCRYLTPLLDTVDNKNKIIRWRNPLNITKA